MTKTISALTRPILKGTVSSGLVMCPLGLWLGPKEWHTFDMTYGDNTTTKLQALLRLHVCTSCTYLMPPKPHGHITPPIHHITFTKLQSALLHSATSTFNVFVLVHIQNYLATSSVLAPFPGSHAQECKHWSCAGTESLVYFVTRKASKVERE